MAAQSDAWKADWEKSLQAAKKEGELVLYGSADNRAALAELLVCRVRVVDPADI